jgi:hypothetical protein
MPRHVFRIFSGTSCQGHCPRGKWVRCGFGHQEASQADGEEEAPQAAEAHSRSATQQEVALAQLCNVDNTLAKFSIRPTGSLVAPAGSVDAASWVLRAVADAATTPEETPATVVLCAVTFPVT